MKWKSMHRRIIISCLVILFIAPLATAQGLKRTARRENWLLSLDATSYTIQIIGLHNEDDLLSFIKDNQLLKHNEIAYFQSTFNSKAWYSLLYGIYPTAKEAQLAANKLPENLWKAKPWVRSIAAVQKAIRDSKPSEMNRRSSTKAPARAISITTDVDIVNVNEGSTATFGVRLTAQPAGNVTVTVSRAPGDTNINVSEGASLTFTTSNWSTYQTVTLSAAEDDDTADGAATITCSSASATATTVVANGVDDDVMLTVTNDGNGSTMPLGEVILDPLAMPYSISAAANPGYTFNNWTVVSGAASFTNATVASTTVTQSASATIRANFTRSRVSMVYNSPNLSISFDNNLLSLSAKEADLKTILLQLSDYTGIIFEFQKDLEKKVTITLSKVEIDEALRRLLRRQNYALVYSFSKKRKINNISKVYIYEKPEVSEIPSQTKQETSNKAGREAERSAFNPWAKFWE